MSATESADLQDNATARLVSQSYQPVGPSVLPPFSGELSEDIGLKLSNQNFMQLIENFFNRNITILSQVQRNPAFPTSHLLARLASKTTLATKWGYLSKGKVLTPISQLTTAPTFPTPHVLAQFAYKSYEDYKAGESDAQYETRLDLPNGWELLTTASNGSKTNGYFGAAYWHPEHQRVVIAHRGTDPTNLGALGSDIKGVLLNQYVSQMGSASTFAHKVVEVLREVGRLKRVSFQLFFTGHSLGGWLAQVTTFTTEYLKAESKIFLKSNNDQDCFHPHTVVFDSPGCKDMLSQMRDTFDVRLHGRSINIEHLDITSYLSAPNRINTCNSHLGTVYRMFPDFSDMGWWERKTASYNFATHSMQKIVEAFDPESGQVHKDEQGQLKVQVVVDWPISSGLLGGEEYKGFFEWAEHLNNYHPNSQDVSFQHKHYYPIRYQTILYDERVNSLRVFSQEEQEFLQSYFKLRQWPEFFKPKELFCAMEDSQAQDEAENILQNFEIESDTVRCTDASALRALIPHVKRLLHLFPEIKEIGNMVYQCETRSCIEQINQSPLDLRPDALNVWEFLDNKQQQLLHLQMVDGDEWTGLIKVYQVLQKTNRMTKGQYTVLKLERFLTLNMLMDFRILMLSIERPNIILVACEANQLLKAETKDMIRALFEAIQQKTFIKIILITRSEGRASHFLQLIGREIFGNGFVTRDEQLTWCELTSSSREKLLEKSVKFQDADVSLNELLSAESPLADCLHLGDLLEEKKLKIAEPVPNSNGYDESHYVGRTFRHHIAIKQDISSDKDVKDKHVFLASSEQEFKQLCQLNPESKVLWVEKDISGKLLCKEWQGSLETVRRYIDKEISPKYTPDDIDKLLEKAEQQRVMLISDTAGMGKSTVLTHLSKRIKQKFPAKWLVRIDLNDHTDALEALKKEHIDKEKAIEFVSEKLLKLESGLEFELFKQCCEQRQKVRIIIMLDGFDEISPFYKETVIYLLQALRQTAVEQIWVTTRPHLREQLEDKLQQMSYTLEPFSEENQVDFLTTFWSLKNWFTEGNSIVEEEDKQKLHVYAKELIKKLGNSISDENRQLTGIPLQTRMLAEAFDAEVKIFYQSAESMPELQFQLDLLGLYGRFIERKYDIYQEEKGQVRVNNVVAKEQRERDVKSMREDHQLLALKVLFTQEQVTKIHKNRESKFSAEQLTRIGIVQVSHDGKPHFIHRTFAEYYVADCLVNRLTEGNNTSQQVKAFILKDVFQKEDYRVVRVFIDGLLSRCKQSEQVLKEYGNQMHGLWKDSQLDDDDDDEDEDDEYDEDDDDDNAYDDEDDYDGLYESSGDSKLLLHRAVREGNPNIIVFLLDSAQAAEDPDTVSKLLLAQDKQGRTAWHQAVYSHNIQVSEKLWECAKRNPRAHNFRSEMLFAKDHRKMNAWHLAVKQGKVEVLLKQWDLAKDNLTSEKVKKLLLDTDSKRRTVFHLAAEFYKVEVFHGVLNWAKENLTTEEVRKLLLAIDNKRRTVFHVAAEICVLEVFQEILNWGKKNLTRVEVNKLLLATDNEERTVFHVAAKFCELEVCQEILNLAKENLAINEVNELLLATDYDGRTVFHLAATFSKLGVFQEILNLAKENLTSDKVNKLLLATDNEGRTVIHVAANLCELEVFQGILNLVKNNLTREEVNKLLSATDNDGRRIFHVAGKSYKLQVCQGILNLSKENLTTEDVNKMLLATDSKRRTVFHVAAKFCELEIFQEILNWAKKNLTREEVNKLLFAADSKGRTVFHVATEFAKLDIFLGILKWAKENLTIEGVNKALLAADNEERTVFHVAAELYKLEVFQGIMTWAKMNITREEVNKLLLATDNEGRTVFHVAAELYKLGVFQGLLNWAKENLRREEVNKFLLATDNKGRTVFHVAAEFSEVEVFQGILNLIKESLTREEVIKLLLSTDYKGRTVFHMARNFYKLEVFHGIMNWAKENLTTEEVKKLLLVSDSKGRTVLHVARKFYKLEVFQEIINWAKGNLTREELNKLLLTTDNEGRTVFHTTRNFYKLDVFQDLLNLAKRNLTREEVNKLLLATDSKGRTVSHVAAEFSELEVFQGILNWAKKNLTREEVNKLLLARDNEGRTIFHVAAEFSKLEVFQGIWNLVKRNLTREEVNKLFLAMDNEGRTVFHVVTKFSELELIQGILNWAKENLTREEVNNLLLVSDKEGRTVLNVAVEFSELEVFQGILNWAQKNLRREEVNKLLLATDNEERTVFHVAAEFRELDVFQGILNWAEENLTREAVCNLLLAKDNEGKTFFHVAAKFCELLLFQEVLNLAKKNLTREEIIKFLLVTDSKGRAIIHVAAEFCELGVIQGILNWAKKNLTREEVNKLLLATDNEGRTVSHLAARFSDLELFQGILNWAKNNLTREEVNKLLLATDNEGRTVFNVVEEFSEVE